MPDVEHQPPVVQVPSQFDAFYRTEYPAVVALSYVLSGSRWVAEDLAQEAFLRAHRDWDTVGRMAAPDAWVRKVAVNLARSRWRRLRSETAAKAHLTASPPALQAPGVESDAFWGEVRRLPARQAQVVALRYVEDLPIAEVASILGLAEGTVRAVLHQAKARLGRQLEAKGWGDELR